ncbi:metal-dependent hydrolase [Mycobacteroides immunogenum]|uniref:Metal-dependent hydrolase n=1 Tax=Mycobacteroides immunogenum TaxID=83262 RepID=A0A7V8LP57_9MYCO|nr:metal-dependent hydrolase [Mycobacteroides immunogenum]AMT71867.1 metal-dependent hydrolase [Mycobacteroides immunogenum]ANO04997.1 metal-dependent hydrolase [Mycobacteroides immunogenum]KIU39426.1 metal-dependent hydrolase [Mycobacteroides immunogenum]KPG07120.1 metal-dependent hydrolase [Mycobacteroides immunogenum]KPG07410.1 metal-dependent hydrolase [Mycobacteroides immunogenum]
MERDIRTRRIKFRYPAGSLRRHYVQDDLGMSHVVAVLSGAFPEGEAFMIRSVRAVADQIADPELKKQVAGFVGQEATHSREHRALNERLQEMGYPTAFIDRATRKVLEARTRYSSARYCVAMTAALEHYTAILAETLLGDERALRMLGQGEVRSMLLWHALEESEHRAVAFDVYQAIGGTNRMRVFVMWFTTCGFFTLAACASLISLLRDRDFYNPRLAYRSAVRLFGSPFFSRAVFRRLLSYSRKGFHPDEVDNSELIAKWNAVLFGEQGQIADHLH